MATEQDAARDRVLAARAEFDAELDGLGASAREAVDIPARSARSPAKAAAVAGGWRSSSCGGRSGSSAHPPKVVRQRRPMPERMLPKEIEKTLDKLGDDGEKVRGAIERDFADYVKKRQRTGGPSRPCCCSPPLGRSSAPQRAGPPST